MEDLDLGGRVYCIYLFTLEARKRKEIENRPLYILFSKFLFI